MASLPYPRNLLRADGVRWLRADGVGWLRGGGCVGMAGMPYPPINTSAPTDADVRADRCEPCREDFLALASGKAERYTSLTTLLVLPYRNNQQCIIPKKAVRHSCHTAFYVFINTD